MPIQTKRIYEAASPEDGYRILIDRLWPRGVSKEAAHLDEWIKEIAPSDTLRNQFHHEGQDFAAFQTAYLKELETEPQKQQLAAEIAKRAKKETVTLLFGAKDPLHNQAVVLKEYIEKNK